MTTQPNSGATSRRLRPQANITRGGVVVQQKFHERKLSVIMAMRSAGVKEKNHIFLIVMLNMAASLQCIDHLAAARVPKADLAIHRARGQDVIIRAKGHRKHGAGIGLNRPGLLLGTQVPQ